MKYILIEGKVTKEQKYNAFGKARGDAHKILEKNGFKILNIPTKNGVQTKKIKKPLQYIQYFKNYKIWKSKLKSLKDGDILFIQYPIINNCLFFSKLLKNSSKRIKTVILIHDLDSIRFKVCKTKSIFNKVRVYHEDKSIGKYASFIISHNESMTKELLNTGINSKKIINLGLFDYLEREQKIARTNKDDGIIIAGNLSIDKANYISKLKDINDVKFNLYGINYDKVCDGKNIEYKGAFLPDELIENLEGSYGLVWDGNSTSSCDGMWGNYLRYNNPHKTSLYLAAGLPVIVWKESALADYIEKNNLGISVNSLDEINTKTKKITNQQYKKMCDNVLKISKRLKSGLFLETAIKTINKKIDTKYKMVKNKYKEII